MKRSVAQGILEFMRTAEAGSFELKKAGKSDPIWTHKWVINKRNLGAYLIRLPNCSQGLYLILSEFQPNSPGNYYVAVIGEQDRNSSYLEMHETTQQDDSDSLVWQYVPKKGDGLNSQRKALFSQNYPDATAYIPIPRSTKTLDRFLASVWEVAHTRIAADALSHVPPRTLNESDEELSAFEGATRYQFAAHRSRERKLRAAKLNQFIKKNGKLFCQVPNCNFDFELEYGELGRGFAHVHHLNPLSAAPGSIETRLRDLAVVCPNCHAMIHRGGECRPLDGLRLRPTQPLATAS